MAINNYPAAPQILIETLFQPLRRNLHFIFKVGCEQALRKSDLPINGQSSDPISQPPRLHLTTLSTDTIPCLVNFKRNTTTLAENTIQNPDQAPQHPETFFRQAPKKRPAGRAPPSWLAREIPSASSRSALGANNSGSRV